MLALAQSHSFDNRNTRRTKINLQFFLFVLFFALVFFIWLLFLLLLCSPLCSGILESLFFLGCVRKLWCVYLCISVLSALYCPQSLMTLFFISLFSISSSKSLNRINYLCLIKTVCLLCPNVISVMAIRSECWSSSLFQIIRFRSNR